MSRIFLLGALCLLLSTPAVGTDQAKYAVLYSVKFLPDDDSAAVQISTLPQSGRLIALDLNMPATVYTEEGGDGTIERVGQRVVWTPPRSGGTIRYRVQIGHRRTNGEYDSRMTPSWVITRGDRLFPAAKVRATKGSGSTARLHFDLPDGWDNVETQFSKLGGGDFAVTNAERRFDRPVGWIAAGNLSSTRETIAETRVTLTSPKGERADQIAAMAILRQALPEMRKAFGKLPEKLLVIRGSNPMWRGGLSAPGSMWLHADRPLISENGTSPVIHELVHVVTDVRGDHKDDWIAEGLAEYYSLEIGRRSKLISEDRFLKSIQASARSGGKIESLRAEESSRDRTRKAVALFAALDAELREADSSMDALTLLLMRRERVTLDELRADARKIEGHDSKVLAGVE